MVSASTARATATQDLLDKIVLKSHVRKIATMIMVPARKGTARAFLRTVETHADSCDVHWTALTMGTVTTTDDASAMLIGWVTGSFFF